MARYTTEQLRKWIDTLSNEKKDEILEELIEYCIVSEYINYFSETKSPYYDATGDRVDGSEESNWDDVDNAEF